MHQTDTTEDSDLSPALSSPYVERETERQRETERDRERQRETERDRDP